MKRLWFILFTIPLFSQDKLSNISWDSLQIDEEYQSLDGVLLYEEIPKKSFFSKPVTFQIDGEVFFRYLDRKEVKRNIWYNIELFDGTRVYNDGWIEAISLQNKQIKLYKEKVAEVVKRDNEREQRLIGKYGDSIARAILGKRIILGMTKEMVLQSLGAPNSQSRTSVVGGTATILSYDTGIYTYVVLTNDIVISFTERY
tara:strand:+ start:33 stop:632 length:600 start_codon:yes stop_codon:yes gene_type:complete